MTVTWEVTVTLRSRCASVTAQAAAINRLVYARYGLTAAESKIVEGGDE